MDTGAKVVLTVYGIVGIFVVIALVYLIDKRIKDKKKEDFEKRDN